MGVIAALYYRDRPATPASSPRMRISLKTAPRNLVFALLPAIFLLLLLELACQLYYFQDRGPEVFALQAALRDARAALLPAAAETVVEELALPPAVEIYEALYSSSGAPLLEDFKRRYAASFAQLAAAVEEAGSKLVVLYVPPPFDSETSRRVDRHDRAFYRHLAETHGAGFLDATAALAAYPDERTHLLPHNVHLARLGNQILAEAVARRLQQAPYRGHRSGRGSEATRPELLGDLPPGSRRVWENDVLPFLVTTNRQGLRMDHDLSFPKRRQRVLLLGDSFTFGINLHDAHTYPALLQALLPGREIVNAGVPGYSIPQEVALFRERARFTEPDVTVLQVLFNDLYGFFYFERNLFARELRDEVWLFGRRLSRSDRYEPSALEKELLGRLGVRF